jgi:hypothetical protein
MLSDLQPDQTTTFDGILNRNDLSVNAVAFKLIVYSCLMSIK